MPRRSSKKAKFRASHRASEAGGANDDVIRLNAEESRIFAEALLNPREPNERLRAAARRYREFIGR
jgi:uncharacterized protein (DUF1778 family)